MQSKTKFHCQPSTHISSSDPTALPCKTSLESGPAKSCPGSRCKDRQTGVKTKPVRLTLRYSSRNIKGTLPRQSTTSKRQIAHNGPGNSSRVQPSGLCLWCHSRAQTFIITWPDMAIHCAHRALVLITGGADQLESTKRACAMTH